MERAELLLADMSLKHFLRLFEAHTPLQVVTLGDTMHPSSGYMDEALVRGVTSVGQLLTHPYDFAGLVFFEAIVPQALITYQAQQYQLVGSTKSLARLVQRIRDLNAAIAEPQFNILTTY